MSKPEETKSAEEIRQEIEEGEKLLAFITQSCNGLTEGVETLRKTLDGLREMLEQVSGESIDAAVAASKE